MLIAFRVLMSFLSQHPVDGNLYYFVISTSFIVTPCKTGGPLTTRQPAEYKWRSGYPTPL